VSAHKRADVQGRVHRAVGFVAIFVAFAVGVVASHGCIDDRKKVAAQVFFCNPASRTADADCGKGFMCYSSAQALGGSICVPECDPNDATTCDGACTASGACLKRCTVPAMASDVDPCPAPLVCSRTTDSPIEASGGNDGVCLPLNAVCGSNADCTSPVFTECTATVNGSAQGMGLLTSGNVCVQGKCNSNGIACEPGSACVRNVLPMSIPAPDVCSPICTPVRDRKAGQTFNECLPGLTCLSDAFPQTDAPACAPGFPGWLCVDKLGCTAGGCYDWGDTSDKFKGFETCAPPCKTDDDCVPFDRGGNPNFLSHNTCHEGVCRDYSSMFFPMICTEKGAGHCKLDPEADCVFPSADMGMVPPMGLGALGGTTAVCVHGCSSPSDCAPLAASLHMPMTCGTINQFSACVPMIPVAINCATTAECFGDLTCEGSAGKSVCTRRCTSSNDCANDPALGTMFFCGPSNVCLPKAQSGDVVGMPDECLSGQGVSADMGVKCVSPTGWSCTDDSQCINGQCELLPDTLPEFGRCR
jgi:hypothetical protein